MSDSDYSVQLQPISRRSRDAVTVKRHTRFALILLISSIFFFHLGCSNGQIESNARINVNYTEPQGDQTSVVLEALGYKSREFNFDVTPLPVPTAVLDYEPYVLSLSTSSSALDVYLLDAPWVKRYSATDWLISLNSSEQLLDLSEFRQELLDVTSLESEQGKQVLAIPFDTKGNLLFYRKDILDQLNLQPPGNWKQLFDQCRQIKNRLGENAPRFGFLYHGKLFINDFYPILWGFGGDVLTSDDVLVINQPANVRALSMIKRTLGTISPSAEEMQELGLFEDYKAVDGLFAAGEAVFMINWNIRWGDLEKSIPGQTITIDQVGVAPIPTDNDNARYSNIGSWCWGVNYLSKHQQEAIQFISAVTSYEAQRWRALNMGLVPARKDVLTDEEIIEKAPSVVKIAKVFEKVILKARPFQREINQTLDDMLLEALIYDLDPEEVLAQAHKRIRSELAWVNQQRRAENGEK